MAFNPLSGIRVLDLTRLLPGPYGTQLLNDLGADIVKIEQPGTGDYLREMEPESGIGPTGMSYFFEYLNAGKRSVGLDLQEPAGREAFYELVADADVVTESFRPGVVDRLEVDYETLTEMTDSLVYCSLTGFGQNGPYRDRSGHDLNYLAVSGILGLTGEPDGPPVIPGTLIADLAAGSFLAVSVLAALIGEESKYIDLSMTDVVATWTLPYMHEYFATGEAPARGETFHQKYPSYNVYETADGEFLALGCLEEHFWANFCDAIDRPDYIEHHHSPDPAEREAIREDLSDLFRNRSRAEWLAEFADHDIPIAPVNDLGSVPDDPQISAREVIVGEDVSRFRFPALFNSEMAVSEGDPPARGEHTSAILEDYGYTERDLEELCERGVIETAPSQ